VTDTPEVHAHPHGAGDIKGALGKKVGPLPVGVWILAVGGGLVFAYYMRSRGGDTTTTDPGTVAPDEGASGLPNGVGQTDDDTGTGTDNSTLPATNEEWQRRVVSVLTGMLYDPTEVDRAISQYLAGGALTTVQRAIVNEAIIRVGPPPQSPPPPETADQPPPIITPPQKTHTFPAGGFNGPGNTHPATPVVTGPHRITVTGPKSR
jgi:hypothetical protein